MTKSVRHAQSRISFLALLAVVTDHVWGFVSGVSTSAEGPVKVCLDGQDSGGGSFPMIGLRLLLKPGQHMWPVSVVMLFLKGLR